MKEFKKITDAFDWCTIVFGKHLVRDFEGLDAHHSTLCGVPITNNGKLLVIVRAALESDCDNCRAAVMVGGVGQKGCEVRQPPVYEPQP